MRARWWGIMLAGPWCGPGRSDGEDACRGDGRPDGRPACGAGGGVGGGDADLAILGGACGVRVVALDTGGGGALLHKASVIHDQYSVVRAEVLGDVGVQVIVGLVGLPVLRESKCCSPSRVA